MHSIPLPDPSLFELTSYTLEAKVLTLEVRMKKGKRKMPRLPSDFKQDSQPLKGQTSQCN